MSVEDQDNRLLSWPRWLLFGLLLCALAVVSLRAPWVDAWIGGVVIAVVVLVVLWWAVRELRGRS